MKYYVIAGEPSGDMHAAMLMHEIKAVDNNAIFEFLGGDMMQAEGGKMHIHYRQMAFMGIIPVITHLRSIASNFKKCTQSLKKFNPDVVILVDYPGFNLKVANFAKRNGITTVYYISPKVWAWKTGRVKKIKADIDLMCTIFPFETAFFKKYDYDVTYVGNPLCDKISALRQEPFDEKAFRVANNLSEKPIVALLPGSRLNEISKLLTPMIDTAKSFVDYEFVVAGFAGHKGDIYKYATDNGLKIVFGQTYQLLMASRAALVASGTATLETALLKIPQVVCYRMSPEWFLKKYRHLILKTKYFSLVNLVADKELVRELFQDEVSPEMFSVELNKILSDNDDRQSMLDGYDAIENILKTDGAAKKAALAITHLIKKA